MNKILIATGLYPPQIGGPATYTKLLNDSLPSLGFEVTVVNFGDVLHLPKIIRHIIYFVKIFRSARGVDCIYALDPVSVGFPTALVARMLRKRFIVRIAGDYAWEQGVQRFGVEDELDIFTKKSLSYSFSVSVLVRVERWVAQTAERIIVPSRYLQKIILSWGISKTKIQVVHSVFEGVGAKGNRQAIRAMLGFGGKLVISAGRLVPWKGFNTLIEIMPKLKKRVSGIRLMIVGDGPTRTVLEKRIKELGLSEDVILIGSLDQRILHSYIRASDVFVLNSSYEGFSHLLLEVMALETPIVTTDSGGNPELITNEKEGLLVRYNDRKALIEAIEKSLNPSHAQKVIRNGSEKLLSFTEEKMLSELIPNFKNT